MVLDSKERHDALRYLNQYKFLASVNIGYLGSEKVGRKTFIFRALYGEDGPRAALLDEQDPSGDPNHDRATLYVTDGKPVLTELERIACHAGYEGLFELMVLKCEAFIFLYDVTNRESFEQLLELYKRLCEIRGTDVNVNPSTPVKLPPSPSSFPLGCTFSFLKSMFGRARTYQKETEPDSVRAHPPMLLVANKIDKPSTSWVVSQDEGRALSKKMDADFVELSAKTGKGCDKVLLTDLTCRILARRDPRAR